MIPRVTLPVVVEAVPEAIVTTPTSATPKTMKTMPVQWWRYCLRPRKQTEKRAVITTIIPLIIQQTEAGTIVKATNMREDPMKSQEAGMAINRGLMLVGMSSFLAYLPPGESSIPFLTSSLSLALLAIKTFTPQAGRHINSPKNMTAACKQGWVYNQPRL